MLHYNWAARTSRSSIDINLVFYFITLILTYISMTLIPNPNSCAVNRVVNYLLKIWKHVVIRTSFCCNQCWWKLELIWWQQLTLCIWTHLKCHTETIFIALKETFIHSCHGEVAIFVSIKYFIFQEFRFVYHVLRLNQREKSNWQDSTKSGNESWSESNVHRENNVYYVVNPVGIVGDNGARVFKRVNSRTEEQVFLDKFTFCLSRMYTEPPRIRGPGENFQFEAPVFPPKCWRCKTYTNTEKNSWFSITTMSKELELVPKYHILEPTNRRM